MDDVREYGSEEDGIERMDERMGTRRNGTERMGTEPDLSLGSTPCKRQLAYRGLFRQLVDDKELEEIRASVNGGLVLDGDRFKDAIERAVARRVRPSRGGRPRKADGRRSVT